MNALAAVNKTVNTARWAPVYTASTWATVLTGMKQQFGASKMTNAEAAGFIREWHNVSHTDPLWFQFAAPAYGYAPPKRTLVCTSAQAAKPYPMTSALWQWAKGIATDLDAKADQPPRIAIDKDTYSDPVWFGEVLTRIAEDGGIRAAPPKKKQPKKSSSGLVMVAVLAWLVLTPNRRSRGR